MRKKDLHSLGTGLCSHMEEITYESNNSGGSWWLTDQDWKKLEEAGWEVEWKDWLGAKATRATREGLSMEEAISEFERITGEDANAKGCDCCGRPHQFC